jgi:RNase H-fold protein (predicted Holliday junction resolvase)
MMSSRFLEPRRVMAVDPTSRGFGFVILEGPQQLVDWAVVQVRKNKEDDCLRRVADLIVRYRPDVVVLEDPTGRESRRCRRVQKLLDRIQRLASKESIITRRFSRAKVRRAFSDSGAKTKYDIAMVIAKRFPELMPRLPRFRKPWMSEDERMSIFDAASFGLTFFRFRSRRRQRI